MSLSPFGEALRRARSLLQDAVVDPSESQARTALLAEIERAESHAPPSRGKSSDGKSKGAAPTSKPKLPSGKLSPDGSVKHDLIAVICHDLRAPLSSVLMGAGFLQKALSQDGKDESLRKIADAIARSSERMNQLVKDLHDVTHMETGKFKIDRHTHALGAIVEAAHAKWAPLAADKKVRFEKEVTQETASIECDRDRIVQVFAKVIDNALRCTPAGGAVTLRASVKGNKAQLAVVDTGRGMPAERLAHAFDRYWHAAQSPREGTGLGLALANGIVTAHGGEMKVESKVGAGTTVSFVLDAAS